MNSTVRLAALLCLAALLGAQDWQNSESLPKVDFTGLTAAQKTTVLKILRDTGCPCGCTLKIAQCRVVDPSCGFSTALAHVAVESIKEGKNEEQTRADLDASPWAHPQPPKLLDDPVQIPTGGAPSLGPDNAAITLVEFSDFQCPYCAAAEPEIQAVLKAYPNQVRLVFKEFPLDFHPRADFAAAAALAAQKQGKFWAMHDALYGSQRDLSKESILLLAQKSGLDLKQFQADLTSTNVRETIVRDTQDGEHAGVEGTPTLFINGQRFNGALTLDTLKPVMDDQLKRAAAPNAN